jgi:hypothetical protein
MQLRSFAAIPAFSDCTSNRAKIPSLLQNDLQRRARIAFGDGLVDRWHNRRVEYRPKPTLSWPFDEREIDWFRT